MLTRPKFGSHEIVELLLENYHLEIEQVFFLPIGADLESAVFRVTAKDQVDYFLKLRFGGFYEASLLVPHYLCQNGIKNIIQPIPTVKGQSFISYKCCKAALYPYIEGGSGIDMKLSDEQWIELGRLIKNVHNSDIPPHITANLKRELFSLKWYAATQSFINRVEKESFKDPISIKTAQFLNENREEIVQLLRQIEQLRDLLQNQPHDLVICHADIHGWNLLIDHDHKLYLIDWDTVILAPKEKDLMFIDAGIWDTGGNGTQDTALFYKGYGETKINKELISYFRINRILEDIAIYCEHIFDSNNQREDRLQSLKYMQANFLPSATITKVYLQDK